MLGAEKIEHLKMVKKVRSRHRIEDRPTRIHCLKQGPIGVLEAVKNTQCSLREESNAVDCVAG